MLYRYRVYESGDVVFYLLVRYFFMRRLINYRNMEEVLSLYATWVSSFSRKLHVYLRFSNRVRVYNITYLRAVVEIINYVIHV